MVFNILIIFVLFLGSLGVLLFVFDKLTANNIPKNLQNHTRKTTVKALIMLTVLFAIAFGLVLYLQ